MHYWPNPSIIKSHRLTDVKSLMAKRPKGLTDQEWNAIVKEEKMNKLILLNKVPKASMKRPSKDAE